MSEFNPLRRLDHVEIAQTRQLEKLKKPKLQALLDSRIKGLQLIEDDAWRVLETRNLEDGFGIILDMLGGLVGRGRAGESDADYLVSIQIQIIQNNASGVFPDYEAIAEIFQPDSQWTIDDTYGYAGFVLYPAGDAPPDPQRALREFNAIRALGTAMVVLIPVAGPATALRWGWSGDAAVGNPGLGWSGDASVGGLAGFAYP